MTNCGVCCDGLVDGFSLRGFHDAARDRRSVVKTANLVSSVEMKADWTMSENTLIQEQRENSSSCSTSASLPPVSFVKLQKVMKSILGEAFRVLKDLTDSERAGEK